MKKQYKNFEIESGVDITDTPGFIITNNNGFYLSSFDVYSHRVAATWKSQQDAINAAYLVVDALCGQHDRVQKAK